MPNAAPQESPDSSKVLRKAVLKAREAYNISFDDLGEVLGISGSQARRLDPEKPFKSRAPQERAVLFLRALRSLETLVGHDSEAGRSWLYSKNKAFDGRCPIDLLKEHEGLVDVVRYLDGMRGP